MREDIGNGISLHADERQYSDVNTSRLGKI
jgi:hypothetical protein